MRKKYTSLIFFGIFFILWCFNSVNVRGYDSFEPNDSYELAGEINIDNVYTNLDVNSSNDDWYKISVNSGIRLQVGLQISTPNKNFSLYLYDSSLEKVDEEIGFDYFQIVMVGCTVEGYYYIKVTNLEPQDENYTLRPQSFVGSCPIISFEYYFLFFCGITIGGLIIIIKSKL